MDIDDVADELYAVSPDQFTATRDERAAAARKAGDGELAKAIRALRKPTRAAAVVNRLARQRPDRIEELLSLGAALREAQGSGAGSALRQLSADRRALISALARDALDTAAEQGAAVNDALEREVAATFEAALADPEAGDAVRSGRLTRALAYAGFGTVDVGDAVAVPIRGRPSRAGAGRSTPARKPPAKAAAQDKHRKKAEAEAAAQDKRRRAADEQAAAEAQRRAEADAAALADAESRHRDLVLKLAELEHRTEEVRRAERDAAKAVRAARKVAERSAGALRPATRR